MQERVSLALALSCSLLGHGVLLFAMPLPPPLQTPRLAGAIEVSLRAGETPVQASRPAPLPKSSDAMAKSAPASRSPTPSKAPIAPTPVPAPLSSPVAAPNPEPAQENGDQDEGEERAAPTTIAAPLAGGRDAGGSARQEEEAPEGMDMDGDALQDYRFAISRAAARFKRYPALARVRGREGRVDIRLIWRPGMRVPQVELHASAGDTLLDEQGLSMLRQAAAQTPLPDVLRARAFSLILSVEFSLKEEN